MREKKERRARLRDGMPVVAKFPRFQSDTDTEISESELEYPQRVKEEGVDVLDDGEEWAEVKEEAMEVKLEDDEVMFEIPAVKGKRGRARIGDKTGKDERKKQKVDEGGLNRYSEQVRARIVELNANNSETERNLGYLKGYFGADDNEDELDDSDIEDAWAGRYAEEYAKRDSLKPVDSGLDLCVEERTHAKLFHKCQLRRDWFM